MLRTAVIAFAAISVLILAGCQTSEIKNTDSIGLADGTPTGTTQSGYGDGKGDSVGGGGAAPAKNADDVNAGKGGEHEGGHEEGGHDDGHDHGSEGH